MDLQSILVIRPNHDLATATISKWGEEVVEYARGQGFQVIDLHGSLANPDKLQEALTQVKPKLIVHYGHGREDALLGQNDAPLFTLDNASQLRGVAVYTVSCCSGRKFAEAIERVGGSFIGYSRVFLFNPFNEAPFRESVNVGVKALIDGKTMGEAYEAGQQEYDKWIRAEFQREIDFADLTLHLIDLGVREGRLLGRKLWATLKEGYSLRKISLQIELEATLDKVKRDEAEKKILEAFDKIQTAELLLNDDSRADLTIEQKQLAAKMVDCAKRRWVVSCAECGCINPINRPYCRECGTFLLTQSVIRMFF